MWPCTFWATRYNHQCGSEHYSERGTANFTLHSNMICGISGRNALRHDKSQIADKLQRGLRPLADESRALPGRGAGKSLERLPNTALPFDETDFLVVFYLVYI